MHKANDQVTDQCASTRTLTSKDLQWTVDLYGTDYLTNTGMPCELAAGHKDRHIHQLITQYFPGGREATWWASWNEPAGESYALFEAPSCAYYSTSHDGYCGALCGHKGPHVF